MNFEMFFSVFAAIMLASFCGAFRESDRRKNWYIVNVVKPQIFEILTEYLQYKKEKNL